MLGLCPRRKEIGRTIVRSSHNPRLRALRHRLIQAAVLAVATPALAQTWDGGGPTSNFSDPGNWNPDAKPTSNASLIFDGQVDLTPQIDTPWTAQSLTFAKTAGPFLIGGNTLTLTTGGITNRSSQTQTLNSDLILSAAQIWNATDGTLIVNGSVANNGIRLEVNGSGNVMVTGRFTSTGALAKAGDGTLTLQTPSTNTISGTTTISGGLLRLIGNHVLSQLAFTAASAAEIDGTTRIASLAGTGEVRLTSGVLTLSGTYPVNQNFTGTITGAGGLAKSGTSIQVLSGATANTFTGTTTLEDGTLTLRKTAGVNALGGDVLIKGGSLSLAASEQIADSATVTLSGGTLQLSAGEETLGALAGTGGSISFAANSTLKVGGNDAPTHFAGQFQGNGQLIKTGTGTLTLSGSSTGALKTTINGGTLRLTSASALGSKAAVSVASGSNLEIDAKNAVSVASLAGQGNVLIKAGSLSLGDSTDTTLTGILSGTGSLIKVGTGTIALGASNTYTGGTTLAEGALAITTPDSLGTGPLTLSGGTLRVDSPMTFDRPLVVNGGSLAVTGPHTLHLLSNATGSGTLTKTGDGTLALYGAHSQAGGLTLKAGTVEAAADASLGAPGAPLTLEAGTLALTDTLTMNRSLSVETQGTLRIADGKTLTLSGPSSFSGVKQGAGTLKLDGSGTFSGSIQSGKVHVTGSYTYGALHLADDPSAALEFDSLDVILANLSGGGSSGGNVRLHGGSLNVRSSGSNTTSAYNGALTGPGGFTKSGSGTLLLGGINTYSGPTRLDGGTLEITREENLGAPTSSLTFNGGTLRIVGTGLLQLARSVNWSGNGGGFDIADPNHTFTLAQALTGIGSLRKSGPGTLVLAAKNTYRGATLIDAGTLRLASPDAIYSASAIQFSETPGASLDLNNHNLAVAALSGNGTIQLGSGQLTVSANTATSTTFAGVIAGTGGLTKAGIGTLALTAANTYTGGTTLAGGTLVINADNNLGDSTSPLDFRGGTLRVTNTLTSARAARLTSSATLDIGSPHTLTLDGELTGTGSLTKTGAGILVLSGANTFTGPITLADGTLQGTTSALRGDIVNNGTLIYNQAFDGLYAGNITGTGSLVKNGAGTVDLTGTNRYAGATTINAGILRATGDNALSSGSVVTLENKPGAALHLNAGAATLGALSGGGASGGNLVLTDAVLTVGSNNQPTTFAGAISGNGALIKAGSGTLTLAGLNTGTGPITINDGVLRLAASNAISDRAAVHLADAPNVLLELNGVNASLGSLEGGGPAGGGVKLGSGRLTIGSNNASTTYAGAITGTGGLTKTGTGTLRLDGSNSYTGGTRLLGGALEISSESHLGPASSELLFDGGILRVAGTGFKSLARPFTWSTQGGGFDIVEANNTFSLNQTLAGAGGLTKRGAGTLVLTAYNTYAGPTRIDGGVLHIAQGITTPGQAITLAAQGELVAGRLVNRAIAGQGKISANGLLLLGDASVAHGFHFDGTLQVGNNTVLLLDADSARLGTSTLLNAGAKLSSLNGMLLETGRTLHADGNASIDGPFVNRGAVQSTATLTLNGNWTNHGTLTAAALVNQGILRHVTGTADLGHISGDGMLTVSGGQKLSASRIRQSGLRLGENALVTLTPDHSGSSHLSSLLLDAGATLDISDNYLIIQATPGTRDQVLGQINQWIASARANHWRGPGITSSLAASNRIANLSAFLNDKGNNQGPLYTAFHGETVDVNSILITHFWTGDITGDGLIDASDYFRIDSGYISQAGGYENGDLNHDGVVDAADYFIIDSAFIARGSASSLGISAVPEPAALSLGAALLLTALSARPQRRRHQPQP